MSFLSEIKRVTFVPLNPLKLATVVFRMQKERRWRMNLRSSRLKRTLAYVKSPRLRRRATPQRGHVAYAKLPSTLSFVIGFNRSFFQFSSRSSQYSVKSLKYPEPIRRLAEYLRQRRCKDIIVMAGAGISTASGIPDFRSPGTGLYYNTRKYNVNQPTDVFDLQYFLKDPHPFLDIIRDFIQTDKRPNIIHEFCKMLENRGQLLRMYTQNIDGLEKKSGISSTRLVEAHGTMDTASCCKCFSAYSPHWTEKLILEKKVPNCRKKGCTGFVKPDIVMFGEDLPKKFYLYPKDFEKCDLLIIMGTSLNVEPFSELVDAVPKRTPRVLLNRDAVGPFSGKRRKNDIFIQGDIGSNIKQLLNLIGWSVCRSDSEETVSEESCSSSDMDAKTWASSRSVGPVVHTKTQPRKEPSQLCVPNSVARKNSQQNLNSKMSSLSVGGTRRSVSAPLSKQPDSSESSIPTEISFASEEASSDHVIVKQEPVVPPEELQAPAIEDTLPAIEDTLPMMLPEPVEDTLPLPEPIPAVLEPSTPDQDTSSLTEVPAIESSLEIESIPSEETVTTLQPESLATELSVMSTEIGEKEDEKVRAVTVESAPSDLEKQSYKTMPVLDQPTPPPAPPSRPTTKQSTKKAPKKGNTVLSRPINIRPPLQPRPLYKVKRQTQLSYPESGKLTSKGRLQQVSRQSVVKQPSAPNQVSTKKKRVPKVRSYSNLFSPDTSEVFKRELNDFISHRSKRGSDNRRETPTGMPGSNRTTSRPRKKSPLTSYQMSSAHVRSEMACRLPDPSPWSLGREDREMVAARSSVKVTKVETSKQPIRTRYLGHVTGY
eukprot:sb/3462104/